MPGFLHYVENFMDQCDNYKKDPGANASGSFYSLQLTVCSLQS